MIKTLVAITSQKTPMMETLVRMSNIQNVSFIEWAVSVWTLMDEPEYIPERIHELGKERRAPNELFVPHWIQRKKKKVTHWVGGPCSCTRGPAAAAATHGGNNIMCEIHSYYILWSGDVWMRASASQVPWAVSPWMQAYFSISDPAVSLFF